MYATVTLHQLLRGPGDNCSAHLSTPHLNREAMDMDDYDDIDACIGTPQVVMNLLETSEGEAYLVLV